MEIHQCQDVADDASVASDDTSSGPSAVTLTSTDGSLTTVSVLENMHSDMQALNAGLLNALDVSQKFTVLERQLGSPSRMNLNNQLFVRSLHRDEKRALSPSNEENSKSTFDEDIATTTDDDDPSRYASYDHYDTTEYSEFLTDCDMNSTNTQELLKHYLENSDSVDALSIYKLEPTKYLKRLFQHIINMINFTILIVTSKYFWNACLMITNVLACVFFYLILAVSTILINIIFNVHDAMASPACENSGDMARKKIPFKRAVT